MHCVNCGQRLDAGKIICPNCGSMVTASSEDINEKVNNIFNSYKESANGSREDTIVPRTPDYYKDKVKLKTSDVKAQKEKEVIKEVSVTKAPTVNSFNREEQVKKGSGIKSFFTGLLVFIILIGAAAFAAYYAYNHFMGSSTTEYTSAIEDLSSQIVKANDDMAAVLKKDEAVLPVEDMKKQASSAIDAFNEINKAFSKIAAPSVYSKSNESLKEAIKLNRQIYQQLGLILKNPAASDIEKNIELLSQYVDDCMKNYTAVKIDKVSFSLPTGILSITSRVQPWAKQKQAEYSQIMSLIDSFSKYFDDMARLFVNYDSSAKDLSQLTRTVRNGQEPWDKLFDEIGASEKAIQTLKADYQKLSVPSELKNINKRFDPILDELLSYYGSLRIAAENEKAYKEGPSEEENTEEESSDNNNGGAAESSGQGSSLLERLKENRKLQEIDALYQEAENLYQSASMNYQQFALDLKGEKDRYLDPEYVLKLKSGK